MTSRAARFASVAAMLYAAHGLADHITGQTDHQARHESNPGTQGTQACIAHVAAYTANTTIAVLAANRVLRLGLSPGGIIAGQVISAITHYWADRDRSRLDRLSVRTGSDVLPTLGKPRTNLRAYVKDGFGERLPLEVVTVDQHGAEHETTFDNPSLGTGSYALDQSWHIGWLAVAALATAIL